MQNLVFSCLESKVETNRNLYARFLLAPFFKGNALTVGTALRRALLSSVESIGIIALYIQGVTHEFSTVAGVRESVLELSLNFQKVVLSQEKTVSQPKSFLNGVQVGYLHVQGPKTVYANDLQLPLGIELVDPTQYIATLSAEGSLILKFLIGKRGVEGNNQTEQHKASLCNTPRVFCPLQSFTLRNIFNVKGNATLTPYKNSLCFAEHPKNITTPNTLSKGHSKVSVLCKAKQNKQKFCGRQFSFKKSKNESNAPFYKSYFFGSSKVISGAKDIKTCKNLSYCKTKTCTFPKAQGQLFNQTRCIQKPICVYTAEPRFRAQSTTGGRVLSTYPKCDISTKNLSTPRDTKDLAKLNENSICRKNRSVGTLGAQNILNAKKTKKFDFVKFRSDMCLRNVIPLDSSISPINKVNFSIETDDIHNQMRERLILEVWTDGSIHPRQAVHEAALSLIEMFSSFRSLFQLNSYSDFSLDLASRDLYKYKVRKKKKIEQEDKMLVRSTKLVRNFLPSFVFKTSTLHLKTKITKTSPFSLYKKKLGLSVYKTRLDKSSLLKSDIGELSLHLKTLSFLKQRGIHKLESFLNLSQADLLHFLNGNKQMFYDIKRFLLQTGLTSTFTQQPETRGEM